MHPWLLSTKCLVVTKRLIPKLSGLATLGKQIERIQSFYKWKLPKYTLTFVLVTDRTWVGWRNYTLIQRSQVPFTVTWEILDAGIGDGRRSWRLTATRYDCHLTCLLRIYLTYWLLQSFNRPQYFISYKMLKNILKRNSRKTSMSWTILQRSALIRNDISICLAKVTVIVKRTEGNLDLTRPDITKSP